MFGGQLQVEGQVVWVSWLDWDVKVMLKDFDFGYFVLGWNGCLFGNLVFKGCQLLLLVNVVLGIVGMLEVMVDLFLLKGMLCQCNFDVQGRFVLQGVQGQGDLKLVLGSSWVIVLGKVGDCFDIDVCFELLQLSDLLLGVDGGLCGQVQVKGLCDVLDIIVDLVGNNFNWDGYGVESVSIKGCLLWCGDSGVLVVQGQQVNVGMLLEWLNIDVQGSVFNLCLVVQICNEMGVVELQGSVCQ